MLRILTPLGGIGTPCRYNSNDLIRLPVAMAHDDHSEPDAHAKKNETLLVVRMLRITDDPGMLVQKR